MSARYTGGLVYNAPGGWSGYFDGSGDYLSIPDNAGFDFGSGNFTIETWVNFSSASREHIVVSQWPGASNRAWVIAADASANSILFAFTTNGTTQINVSASSTFNANAWYHIAVCRDSTNLRIFVNGVLLTTYNISTNTIFNSSASVLIGAFESGSIPLLGYVSNCRIVKGTALYTAAFTPPSGPLQAITNTSLLTCAYPTFRDGSTNNLTVTAVGNTVVSTLNPFPTSQLPNPALGGAGNGVYTMSQYAALKAANLWPAFDPFYRNVTLNLHGNAGAVLPFNTDASTNNFQVTQVGDTRPSNLTPFIANGYWSVYFGGSTSNRISAPANAAFAFGTGAFTVEAWVYITTLTTENFIFDTRSSVSTAGVGFSIEPSTGKLRYSGNANNVLTTTAITANTWNHVAWVYNGTTLTGYINGVSGGTATPSFNITQNNGEIGNVPFSGVATTGYLSNVRVVKGTAVYTGNFTPSTTPLTAISGTSLLTCQSNRFVDNSSNAFTLTIGGSPSVDPLQPFTAPTGTSAYGSGFFDGTGDSLTVASNAAFYLSTGNFTVEAWVYKNSSGTQIIIGQTQNTSPPYAGWLMYVSSSNFATFEGSNGSSIVSSSTFPLNQWVHVASVRSSATTTLYINGTSVASGSVTITDFNASLTVGQYTTPIGGTGWNGYISNCRIVKGTAVYTSAFTPPTSPLTAITNTSLLTVQTNAPSQNNTFLDSSTNNWPVTRFGNTTQGTLSPYGNDWSNNFVSGSYLTFPDSQAFNLSGGSYTIECWINPTGNYSNYNTILAKRSGDTSGTFIWELFLFITSGNLSFVTNYGTAVNTGVTPTANVWSHVAVVYDGTNASVYLNGVRLASAAQTNTNGSSSVYVGSYPTYSEQFLGSISNMRITKGGMLYTGTSFSVPTTPLTNVVSSGNVVLLTCQDNRFRDNSPVNAATTVTGSTTVQKSSPFTLATQTYTSYGASFDGSGDYVTAPTNAAFALGTGDYTWEVWIYKTTSVRVNLTAISGGQGLAIAINTSGNLEVCRAGTAIDYTFTAGISNNVWTHLAVTRSGTSLRAFKDGTLLGTQTSSNNYGQGIFYIAIDTGGSGDTFAGSMSNLRLVKGTALYTASFTVPTSPLTAVSGTSLLTLQSSMFIDNSSNAFALTPFGTAQPILANPFGYGMTANVPYSTSVIGGSGYFDGSDYLSVSPPTFGTDSFTIEFWVYPTAATTTNWNPIMAIGGSGGGQEIRISQNINGTGFGYLIPNNSNNADVFAGFGTLTLNTWHHLALVRNGSTVTFYRNGIALGSTTSVSFNFTNTGALLVGYGKYAGDGYFTGGYISDLRITKGSAVYTSNFTPTIAPLTAITNTQLLLNYTNAAILDNAMMNDLETVGNAQISTSVKKYGSASMYFDGSGDGLTFPAMSLGSGDLTVEWWGYQNANLPYLSGDGVYAAEVLSGDSTGALGIFMYAGTSSVATNIWVYIYGVATVFQPAISITLNQWNHFALTRASGSWRLFVNGTQVGTTSTTSGTYNLVNQKYIGWRNSASFYNYFQGYIDDLRITKAARYTANFTPPTSQVQDQ